MIKVTFHSPLNIEQGCFFSPPCREESIQVTFPVISLSLSVLQGNRGGSFCLRLCSGHPLLGQQGPAAIADPHGRRQAQEQGIVGDLQRPGAAGLAAVPSSQPARAVLLPAHPDLHGPIHLEEAPLRRGSDHHHALLVRPGLLLLPGRRQNL